jgi:hypothetical protein
MASVINSTKFIFVLNSGSKSSSTSVLKLDQNPLVREAPQPLAFFPAF